MQLPTDRACLLAQVRVEDVVEPTPAHLFRSSDRVFFSQVGTNGSITARIASFLFWKKGQATPDFFDSPGVNFPDEHGISRFDDGTIMFTLMWTPQSFLKPLDMVAEVKAGLAEMECMAGDEWLQ